MSQQTLLQIGPEQTCEILDRCLLTNAGMGGGPEALKTFDVPFPLWFARRGDS
jgi:hypothetical protein